MSIFARLRPINMYKNGIIIVKRLRDCVCVAAINDKKLIRYLLTLGALTTRKYVQLVNRPQCFKTGIKAILGSKMGFLDFAFTYLPSQKECH